MNWWFIGKVDTIPFFVDGPRWLSDDWRMEFLADMGGVAQLGEFIIESAGAVGGAILGVVLFPFTVCLVVMLIDCLKSNHTTGGKAVWIFVMLFLYPVGSVLYYLFSVYFGIHAQGKVVSSTNFYSNGKLERQETYQYGKLMSTLVWKPNEEKCPVTNVGEGNGVVVRYNKDGAEFRRWTYKDGKIVSN